MDSTSYVTDADGNIAQHVEYIPYGEVFVEERNSQFSTNFLFNAKELDNETGLYYYGASCLDTTGAMWLSVDPLFEKYAGMSPYNYCAGNPVKLVDPDGEDIVGNTSSDATTLCGLINQQLTPYEGMIDGISDYFYVNGNNLDCRYENLSPILKQIKNCQKDGILDDQMANDLKDLLYGYTAGIASERSIIFFLLPNRITWLIIYMQKIMAVEFVTHNMIPLQEI